MPNRKKSPNTDSLFFDCDVTVDEAIKIISEYAEMNFLDECDSIVNDKFEHRSISKWACYELLNRLMDDPELEPITQIEWFIYEMESGTRLATGERAKETFEIAADVGREIELLFT